MTLLWRRPYGGTVGREGAGILDCIVGTETLGRHRGDEEGRWRLREQTRRNMQRISLKWWYREAREDLGGCSWGQTTEGAGATQKNGGNCLLLGRCGRQCVGC